MSQEIAVLLLTLHREEESPVVVGPGMSDKEESQVLTGPVRVTVMVLLCCQPHGIIMEEPEPLIPHKIVPSTMVLPPTKDNAV